MIDVRIATHCSGIMKTPKTHLNEGLGCIRALVGDTAAASSALS